eukprot:3971-Heterococcus_DN1.PRE.5
MHVTRLCVLKAPHEPGNTCMVLHAKHIQGITPRSPSESRFYIDEPTALFYACRSKRCPLLYACSSKGYSCRRFAVTSKERGQNQVALFVAMVVQELEGRLQSRVVVTSHTTLLQSERTASIGSRPALLVHTNSAVLYAITRNTAFHEQYCSCYGLFLVVEALAHCSKPLSLYITSRSNAAMAYVSQCYTIVL